MNNEIVIKVGNLLEEVRNKKPLVHNITNYVTVNDCANILLAMGASPIMADDIKEATDITKISSALVINIGTLNERTVESMIASGKKANELNIPVVFDPVGAGASEFRNSTTKRIIEEVKISVLRGNMSEIKFISGLKSTTKGVDASESDIGSINEEGADIAENLAKKLNCTVGITGVTDIVSDGKRTAILKNGIKMLANVTGTGCMTSALVGGFCGVATDYFIAAISGIISMGIAGEIALEKAGKIGIGSFRVAIIDAISNMNSEIIKKMARIQEMKPKIDYSIYLVTDRDLMSTETLEEAVELAIKGGCTLIQLREKNCSFFDFYNTAIKVKEVTDKYNVPLLINDRLDIALAVDAAGVHVGQSDLPVPVVRKIIGEDKIIGISTGTLEEALQGQKDGADYLGVGAMYTTGTKKDANLTSMEELKKIRENVSLPIVVIGGINKNTAKEFNGTGIDGLAIVSAIIEQEDIIEATKELKNIFTQEKH